MSSPAAELLLPRRLASEELQISEQSADEITRALAQKLHVNLVYAGNPAWRFSVHSFANDTAEQALRRVFDEERFLLTHTGSTYEVHPRGSTLLRRTPWSDLGKSVR